MKQFMPAMFLVWMFLVWKLGVGAYGTNLRDARASLHAACTTLHERLVGRRAVAGLQWYWRLLMIARWLFAGRRLRKAACSHIRRLLAEARGGLQRGRAVAVAEFSRIRAHISAQLDTPQAAITRWGLARLRGGGSLDDERKMSGEKRTLEPTGSTDSPTPNEAHEASSRPH